MQEQFGRWLVRQAKRMDWVGQLAEQAARDRKFPTDATPEEVRLHLSGHGADADLFEMLDDAESEWLRIAA